MNLVERAVRKLDRFQQRTPVLAFPVAVVKKFGDDQGGLLAVLLAYYSFTSLFPLLLVFTTILGFIGNDKLEGSLVATTLQQFPVVGAQLGRDAAHPLAGSGLALVVGLGGALYGALGVAQSGQHAMAQVWNVPGVVRPGFVPRLLRSLLLFATLGLGMALTTAVSGLATLAGRPGHVRAVILVGDAILNMALYLAIFRVLTPPKVRTRVLVRGSIVGGLGYTVLLSSGTALVQHQLRHAQAAYGQFGFVLGLLAWLYLVARLTLYAAELNVVSERRLWPRTLVQPPLNEADKRVLHDIARQEERRPEQRVGVGFDPDATVEAAVDAETPAPGASE